MNNMAVHQALRESVFPHRTDKLLREQYTLMNSISRYYGYIILIINVSLNNFESKYVSIYKLNVMGSTQTVYSTWINFVRLVVSFFWDFVQ